MNRKRKEHNFQLLPPVTLVLLVTTITCTGVAGQRTEVRNGTISPPQRTLICRFTDLTGSKVNLPNPIFYLDGEDVRTRLAAESFTEERGRITFPLTQELEENTPATMEPLSLWKIPLKSMVSSFQHSRVSITSNSETILLTL